MLIVARIGHFTANAAKTSPTSLPTVAVARGLWPTIWNLNGAVPLAHMAWCLLVLLARWVYCPLSTSSLSIYTAVVY